MYGLVHGFSTRKNDKRCQRNGECEMHSWVCSREGQPRRRSASAAPSRVRASMRLGCPREVTTRLDCNGGWYITVANVCHNHELVPGPLSCFMRERRTVTDEDIAVVKPMLTVGFRQCDIMRLLVYASGGHNRVGFLTKDMNNRKLKDERFGNCSLFDAGYAYLMSRQASDQGMSLVTTVEGDEVVRMYWSDTNSKLDYGVFGDAVALDSTFKTNAYGMQMVVIVGVNYHHQTIVFEAALMVSETTDDYKWLLSAHAQVMGSKVPISMVTNADRAMIAVVLETWPTARHRLCLWHMSRIIVRRVHDPTLRKTISSFMYNAKANDQVEQEWDDMMTNICSVNIRWLNQLYDRGNMWWMTFCRGHFWAELRSTPRCERMHAFMKGYFKTHHKVHKFLHHYKRAVTNLRHKESMANYNSANKSYPLRTMLHSLEGHASRIYTLTSFRKVQFHIQREALFFVKSVIDGNINRVYRLHSYDGEAMATEVISFTYGQSLNCTYQHFETYGMPCAHIFHIMKVEGMKCIPPTLVLHRWTRRTRILDFPAAGVDAYGINLEEFRRGVLTTACQRVCFLGSKSEAAYEHVRRSIHELTISLENKEAAEGKALASGDVKYKSKKVHLTGDALHNLSRAHHSGICNVEQGQRNTISEMSSYGNDNDMSDEDMSVFGQMNT